MCNKSGSKGWRFYLCDLAKACDVNGSILGDGHRVPALILRLGIPAPCWGVWAATVFLWQKLLLDFDLFPVLFQLCLLVDLIDCFRTQVSSTRNPIVLRNRRKIHNPHQKWLKSRFTGTLIIYLSEVQNILQHEADSGRRLPLFDYLVHLGEILIHARLVKTKHLWLLNALIKEKNKILPSRTVP